MSITTQNFNSYCTVGSSSGASVAHTAVSEDVHVQSVVSTVIDKFPADTVNHNKIPLFQ